MKFTYDQLADALYIQLTDKQVHHSKRINYNFALDFDSEDEVIGIEVLNVRKRDLDPFELATKFVTAERN